MVRGLRILSTARPVLPRLGQPQGCLSTGVRSCSDELDNVAFSAFIYFRRGLYSFLVSHSFFGEAFMHSRGVGSSHD